MTDRMLKLSVLVLVLLVVSLAVVTAGAQDAAGDADDPGVVTFTKWITTFPDMEGVVGGAVGDGAYVGEILDFVPGDDLTTIEAIYHINGGTYAFTTHMFVWQNEEMQNGVIRGVVTDGWMQGSFVQGTYTFASCPDQTDVVCYEGELLLDAHSELRDAAE